MTDALALPVSQDVERLVLGCIILDPELMHDARGALTPDDFGLEKHRRIWAAMCAVYDSGAQVDRITAGEQLRNAGHMEERSALLDLDEGIPQLPDLGSYTKILQDQAARRRVILACDDLMKRAATGEPIQPLLDSLAGLSVNASPADCGKGLISARELVERVGLNEILSPRIKRGVPFPWGWMTSATCGMLPGELWVLAAHTSAGKTSAAIQTAVHVARAQSKTVAVFSLEMGDVSVFQRAVWQASRVDSEDAKRGRLTPDERRRAADAANMLTGLPLCFDDRSSSVLEIHARLRRQRGRGSLGLIVVDYLQLLRDGGRHGTPAEAVGANARVLKLLSSEFECPVLLLSQFNRDSAKPARESAKGTPNDTAPRPPELYDLKESGDIENHANGVWFIHRESLQDAEQIPVKFILAKQRDGRRNIRHSFVFLPRYQRFDAQAPEGGEE